MGKRPCHKRRRRPPLIKGRGLSISSSSAEVVANGALRVRHPEFHSQKADPSTAAVRRIPSAILSLSPSSSASDTTLTQSHHHLHHSKVDALKTKRGNEGGWVVVRVITQLLTELEDQRQGVYIIGATNRIDVIDDAVWPVRFGKKHYVPLPGGDERVSILKACARSKPISSGVDLDALARREECNNLTGADLASLVNEADMAALEERLEFLENGTSSMSSSCLIELSHFEHALSKVKPSVSEQQRKNYVALSEVLVKLMDHLASIVVCV